MNQFWVDYRCIVETISWIALFNQECKESNLSSPKCPFKKISSKKLKKIKNSLTTE